MQLDGASGYRSQLIFGGIGYNSELTNPDDLPDTWEEIADPKWTGKYIVDPRGTLLSLIAVEWGQEKTLEWYENMLTVAPPQIVEGATASVQKVISGEAVFSTSIHDAEALEAQADGAPVEVKWLDPVHTRENYTM